MMDQPSFRAALERTLHSNLTLAHPVFAYLLSERAENFALLKTMALQGYQLTKNFLTYIEHLFFYCPAGPHKTRLLYNMFEEETGRLSRTKNHVQLMQDFIRALGISDAERDAAVALSATQELIDYRMNAVVDPSRYHIGAAAVMIASEGQNLEKVGNDARHVLLGKRFNIAEADLRFFSVHQKEDVGHVQHGLDLVTDICSNARMQEEALYAVDHTCALFSGMYEAVYRLYCVQAETVA